MSEETQALKGRYFLEECVAKGGMATVWRARDDVLARVVAVKLLDPGLAQDANFLERFRREALAAARLTHPNIVSIYDTGRDPEGDEERHFIVMEYCGGGTLEDILGGGPLEVERALGMGASICDALDFAHKAGVIHRDIKPANVLISDHGSLKVTDFGIAKAAFASGDLTTTGSILGTMTYISPEQANGSEPDARSDLYSLGIVLYLALVGRPPFEGDSEVATALKHLHEEPLSLRSVKAGIPRAVDAAIQRALSKDPNDRYTSAAEMRDALIAAVGGRGEIGTQVIRRVEKFEPAPDTPDTSTFLTSEARRIVPIVLLALVAIAVVALALGLREEEAPTAGDKKQNEQEEAAESEGGSEPIKVTVSDFDPHGGDGENPEEAPLASDGDEGTSWSTSSYQDPLPLVKPGVGLLFDLGKATEVAEVEVTWASPGATFELRAAESPATDEQGFELIKAVRAAGATSSIDAKGNDSRYWLVWITDLPGGAGGSAAISEVTFFGP